MKKSLIIMPLAMAMMLSGCALFKKNSSNNQSQASQQGSAFRHSSAAPGG